MKKKFKDDPIPGTRRPARKENKKVSNIDKLIITKKLD